MDQSGYCLDSWAIVFFSEQHPVASRRVARNLASIGLIWPPKNFRRPSGGVFSKSTLEHRVLEYSARRRRKILVFSIILFKFSPFKKRKLTPIS